MSNRAQTHNVRIVGPGAHSGEYGPEHDMLRFTPFNGATLPAWLQNEAQFFNYGIAGEYHAEGLVDATQAVVTNHTLQLKAKLQTTTGIVGHNRLLNGANVTYANWINGEVVSIADEFFVNEAIEWYARWDLQEGFSPLLWVTVAGAPLDEATSPLYVPFYQFAMATPHVNRFRFNFIDANGLEHSSDSNFGLLDAQMQDWNRHRLEYRGDGIMHFFLNGSDVWQSDVAQVHTAGAGYRVRMSMQVGGIGRHSGYASTTGTPVPTADLNTAFTPSLMEVSHVKHKRIPTIVPAAAVLTGLGALSATATSTTPIAAAAVLTGLGALSATGTVTATGVFPVVTLDWTGNTVPPHNQAPPGTNVAYMAPTTATPPGNDANAGTQAAPVATFDVALSKITSGGTIVVRGGSYNQRSAGGGTVSNKFFTCMSFPGEQAWFDGGNTFQTFGTFTHATASGTIKWKGIGWRNFKTGGNPGNLPASGPGSTAYPGTQWGGGQGNTTLYLSGGNGGCIHILEDCAITKTNGVGFDFTEPHVGSRFTRVVVCDHGSTGLNGTGSIRFINGSTSTTVDPVNTVNNLIIEDCYFGRCNTSNYGIAFEAGAKIHQMKGCTVRGCMFEDINYNNVTAHNVNTGNVEGAYGAGIWFDVCNTGIVLHSNFARRCTRSAYFFEVGMADDGHIMANNLAIDCGKSSQDHAGIRIATANVRMWHNTSAFNSTYPFEIYDDVRSRASFAAGNGNCPTDDTNDIEMVNNLFTGEVPAVDNGWGWIGYAYDQGSQTGGTGTNADAFFDAPAGRWGKNGWYKGNRTNYFRVGGTANPGQYSTPALLSAPTAHPEMGATDVLLAASPYVDAANRNMRVAAGSPAHLAGEALPSDIAALLSVYVPSATAGSVHDFGYLDVPIPTWA